MTSELETHLVSVERVKEYSETATEVNNKLEEKRLLITAFHNVLRDLTRAWDPFKYICETVYDYLEIRNELQIKAQIRKKSCQDGVMKTNH